ncbi:hypothetical protein QO200_02550 [Flavobacterium sp. Arc3]|uniref:hypothetical protein n=1 Tax=Flavobacterium sp. Arc3 TaxID=3046686 RepID=UPI00352CE8E6
MKKLIVALTLLSIIACKDNEVKKEEPSLIEAVRNVNKLNKAADSMKEYEKQTEKLKKIKPVSNEVFKQVLTDELGNLKRSSFNAGNASMVGLSSSDATYGDSNAKNVKISIFDGAGESGSALIAMTHMSIAMDTESIEGTKTKKTEVINGVRSITENDTNPDSDKSSSITFIYNDRYQVSLEGNKMQLEELKTYIQKLNLSKLP